MPLTKPAPLKLSLLPAHNMTKKSLLTTLLSLTICLVAAPSAQATCNFYASPANTTNWTNGCTIPINTVDGIDQTTLENSTTNTSSLTIGAGGNITINGGGELRVGSVTLNGGSIAIEDTGAINLGAPIWITDPDADGWPTDFTLYNATSSGRRRLALMRTFSELDCGSNNYNINNTCTPPTNGDGGDGSVTFTANTNLNTTNRISGRSCADGGDAVNYSVTGISSTVVTLSSSPSSGCLAVDDVVMLINLQGTSSYYANVGNYELSYVTGVSGNTITLGTLENSYGNTAGSQANIGTSTSNQRVMLQRVPNYTNATVNSGVSVYPSAWNGTKGGVLAFLTSGTLTVTGTIHANSMGFRGGTVGAGGVHTYSGGGAGEAYCGYNSGNGGWQEGVAPAASCGGGGGGGAGNSVTAWSAGGIGGSGGGGGGTASGCSAYSGGGGGGGYGTVGYGGGVENPFTATAGSNGSGTSSGRGGQGSYTSCHDRGGGGGGGGTYGIASLTKIYLGSAGASGGRGNEGGTTGMGGSGGRGGGAILIQGSTINITGAIQARGANGSAATKDASSIGGSGGGGAGGSIKIVGNNVSLGTTKVTATGGTGNTTWANGGNGGSGRIRVEYSSSISGSTSPAASTASF